MEVVDKDKQVEETLDNTFVNEVKLQKYDKNLYGLNRNGHAMRCPTLVPSSICNSACPLFLMRKKADDSFLITISCGSGHCEHEVKDIMPYVSKK